MPLRKGIDTMFDSKVIDEWERKQSLLIITQSIIEILVILYAHYRESIEASENNLATIFQEQTSKAEWLQYSLALLSFSNISRNIELVEKLAIQNHNLQEKVHRMRLCEPY